MTLNEQERRLRGGIAAELWHPHNVSGRQFRSPRPGPDGHGGVGELVGECRGPLRPGTSGIPGTLNSYPECGSISHSPSSSLCLPSRNRARPSGRHRPNLESACATGRRSCGRNHFKSAKSSEPPKKTRHVAPEFPELPSGTTVGGIWVGEALLDQQGKVANVWTIRPLIVKPAFPPLNEAIVNAIREWEFEPSMVE